MASVPLTPEDRAFLSLVNQAVFANPFSDDRVAIDLKITGQSPQTPYDDRIGAVTETVRARLRRLEESGLADFRQVSGKDQSLMKNSFLFDFFHQFIPGFDAFIPRQIKAGDTSLRVPFAREALALLAGRGFDKAEACRYFALCFQLRRAFYFIDRNLVGRSPCMKTLRKNLWNNVFTYDIGLYDAYLWNRMEDFSTLILGETGTGKGTSAVAIGRSGFIPFDEKKECFVESFTRSFISLNLSQFPETLIESELFGHRKGAFTGAVEEFKGIFDRCSPYGAIFLDEIGEVSIPVQIKLLQILQERVFSPVGSHKKQKFQGRVIAATNQSIDVLREKGKMRDDFFYRLCSDVITVPPLRLRLQEDPLELDELAGHTIERILGQPSPDLTEMVTDVIKERLGRNYMWPGNVRELEQCVRRILLKADYEGDRQAVGTDLKSEIVNGVETGDIDAHTLMSGYCRLLYQRHGTYEEVARRTRLDRRTVKKHIHSTH